MHGVDARASVAEGVSLNAGVVTAAAVIMVSVFGGFVFAELTMIRPVGVRAGAGVLVDAFLVRMTLTPAVLTRLESEPGGCLVGWPGRCPTSTSRAPGCTAGRPRA